MIGGVNLILCNVTAHRCRWETMFRTNLLHEVLFTLLKRHVTRFPSSLSDVSSRVTSEVLATDDQLKRILTLNKITDFSVGDILDNVSTKLNKIWRRILLFLTIWCVNVTYCVFDWSIFFSHLWWVLWSTVPTDAPSRKLAFVTLKSIPDIIISAIPIYTGFFIVFLNYYLR